MPKYRYIGTEDQLLAGFGKITTNDILVVTTEVGDALTKNAPEQFIQLNAQESANHEAELVKQRLAQKKIDDASDGGDAIAQAARPLVNPRAPRGGGPKPVVPVDEPAVEAAPEMASEVAPPASEATVQS